VRTAVIHIMLALLCVQALWLTGCDEKPGPSPADRAVVKRTIRIGLVPEVDIFAQKKRYELITGYLEEELGINIELKAFAHYGELVAGFATEGLDGAFFGCFTGALAMKKLGVSLLARPEGKDGASTSQGVLFARREARLRTAADLRGKRFAFVDRATTAGWLLPLHFFQELGIADYGQWFSETYFAGTHEDAIHDVLNGAADLGVAKGSIFEELAGREARVAEELEILATSIAVPENALAVRTGLAAEFVAELKQALLGMDRGAKGREILERFGAVRFVEARPEDYEAVIGYAAQVGQGLDGTPEGGE